MDEILGQDKSTHKDSPEIYKLFIRFCFLFYVYKAFKNQVFLRYSEYYHSQDMSCPFFISIFQENLAFAGHFYWYLIQTSFCVVSNPFSYVFIGSDISVVFQ